MQEIPEHVLVVTPHPDDAEIWCGGTISKWVTSGANVHYLLCTNGNKGTDQLDMSPELLGQTREQEQILACSLLGVDDVIMLHHSDGELEDTREFRKQIVRQIRKIQPQIVLCAEPYRRNLAWHRDHRIAGQVTLDAVFPYARDHLHFEELWKEEGLEPHKTATILFWGTEIPDTYIDIESYLENKIRAVQAHSSQLARLTEGEVEQFVKEEARKAGKENGLNYAESFRRVNFRT